ncbi:MAG: ABC transporter permease subunit [Hoeflea sp.]|uniref:ABC transporter permease n=1 Tax=Hoeflea sp. TaxID=1940281 RepID=UPI001E0A85F4|nr:ABC transporter permease subunit [Hoeflea sp.]MBU4531975.1 ABC transporter permease subunit [Alphaproteobacteria bacterium]MBU4546397.1 ABC transporter permease subunit [Alphaproteobacteria bacterium]MBU4549526.1 ABC transporter permease subunit [Alphaproteobacteria bacterium]MBV1722701.1 ABC transporter permease subunit [Hoeflea sp.]MBV1782640.1 ABC transporter permease subunit [Hoeflea sp.]
MQHRPLILKLLSAFLVFGAWEIAGRVPVSYAFPTFFESMDALLRLTLDGTMFKAYAETLKPLVTGVAISAVLGIGLGLWIGLSARFDWLFSPIFIVMQAAPLAALIPLLVMAYGIGLTSKVFVVCIMAMPVIVLNTSSAVRNTPVSLKEMGRSFLATDRDTLLKIVIPAASPVIFSGLRLGISAGFIGAILAELKITPTGVGDIISYSRSIADYPSMYAAIFSIILLAVLFLNLLEKFENYLFEGNNRGYVSD